MSDPMTDTTQEDVRHYGRHEWIRPIPRCREREVMNDYYVEVRL